MAEPASADTAKAADQSIPPKADAGSGGTMLDQVLTKLDSLHQRMDGFDEFMKSKKADDGDLELKHEGGTIQVKGKPPEEAAGENKSVVDKKRKDSAAPATIGKSDAKKADGEDEDEKDDAAKKSDQLPPQFQKGDKKKDSAKKADWDDDDEDKKDSKRKDAKKADEDEDGKDDAVTKGDARADEYVRVKATDWKTINDQLSTIHNFVHRPDEERAKFAEAQAFADTYYGAHSKRAPANLPGETLADYERRLVTPFRQFSKAWSDVKMSELPDSAFRNAKEQIYADAMRAAENPPDLGEGELRRRDVVDKETGARRIEWLGNESFIKALGRPARRVAGFKQRTA